MSAFDADLLAEKAAAMERHLSRVAARLPSRPEDLQPATDTSDAVILHLWQAVQIALDLAMAACVHLRLGAPGAYADAFHKLFDAGYLGEDLAKRLALAAGFRNHIAHAYEKTDMHRVHQAAVHGPDDLRALIAVLRDFSPGIAPDASTR